MVSGAIHLTAFTVRPALQIIKTRPNAEPYIMPSLLVALNVTVPVTVPITSTHRCARFKWNSRLTQLSQLRCFDIEPQNICLEAIQPKRSGFVKVLISSCLGLKSLMSQSRPWNWWGIAIWCCLQFQKPALKHQEVQCSWTANVFIFPGIEATTLVTRWQSGLMDLRQLDLYCKDF